MNAQLNEKEIYLNTILNQRNVLYKLKNSEKVGRQDLEVLAFSQTQRFFSSIQLHMHYPHTNVQVLKKSLHKLYLLQLLQMIRSAKGRAPIYYAVSAKGIRLLNQYCRLMGQKEWE